MCVDMLLPTNGWDCGDYFPQFEFVEDCCFSCSIKPYHQDPHLLLSYEALQQISKNVPHDSDDEVQQEIILKPFYGVSVVDEH